MWYEQWITLPSTTMAEFDSGIKIGDRILQVKKKSYHLWNNYEAKSTN